MKPVVWRRTAERDAAEAAYWLASQGGLALGERFLAAVAATLDQLSRHPASGSARHAAVVPDLPAPLRFRRIDAFDRYLVYYVEMADYVEIVRIWHAARGLHALPDDQGETT